MNNKNYGLRHLSIRVPWHDDGWRGNVCKKPKLNEACLALRRIAVKRNDDAEEAIAGTLINKLDEKDWPICVEERGFFMAPFGYDRTVSHPYSSFESHKHLCPTTIHHPPYSAPAIPFRWMLRENMEKLRLEYGIENVDEGIEPDLGFKTDWVQDLRNQKPLLDCFFEHVQPGKSLVFFYAKRLPFVEETKPIIVGVGRVKYIGKPVEYETSKSNALRCMIWERMIQHSIRSDFEDGFLLPYREALKYAENNPDFNPVEIVAFAPNDRREEFLYATEHVTNDGAIGALLSCAAAISRAKKYFSGPWDKCLHWIDERLAELWKMRGPCPGLGAALCAFPIELGTFVAREIAAQVGDNEDPWSLVGEIFKSPEEHLSPQMAKQIGEIHQKIWKSLSESRIALLKLLSRFEITPEQAKLLYNPEEREKVGIECTDEEILENPYLIYELTRHLKDPVSVWTVDRGVFPDSIIREKHPLPKPSAIDTSIDKRRVRAFTVYLLEEEANKGHTVCSQKYLVEKIRSLHLEPRCEVSQDVFNVAEKYFPGVVELAEMDGGSRAYQLTHLAEMGEIIRRAVRKRIKATRHDIEADWRTLLDEHLPSDIVPDDELEENARREKVEALKELAESRFSVLIGPAGTGKTTLLSVLCKQENVAKGGVLLLAPTGKARVKMEQATGKTAYTVAQFLSKYDRFDVEAQRYHLSDEESIEVADTVIVDEASMLTEEMLGALIDSLKGVKRLILVGDPHQLPPIGPGRPFVDIVSELTPDDIETIFPKVGRGYAELTIRRRQAGEDRPDLQLAEWFSGNAIAPGEDEIFEIITSASSQFIRFLRWEKPEEIPDLLLDILIEELNLRDMNDIDGFDVSIGALDISNFNKFRVGAAEKVEDWQILSPVRGMPYGVSEINRLIHKTFRSHIIRYARMKGGKIPRPMGNEEIVYGDKIINVRNHPRQCSKDYNPKDGYVANGEVGIAIGQIRETSRWVSKKHWLEYRKLRVEFASQPGFIYDFTEQDFGEETQPMLELAYALTVHKAQGSEFGLVIFVLPNPCRLLSGELLYTALTRQRERVVILHQGDIFELKKYASDLFSETANRMTNLFKNPYPVEVEEGRFLEKHLINLTLRGELVRSKSELVIANRLHENKIDYSYERPLTIGDVTKYPDFTIVDDETGVTYYWEHCGMLYDPGYKKRWEKKLKWYKENNILPYEEGGGKNGALIVTSDTEEGGISTPEIEGIIKKVFVD